MRKFLPRNVRIGLAVIAVLWLTLAALLILKIGRAAAHSWYPEECCSDADCEPIASEHVQERPDGFSVFGGRFTVPHDQARPSPDGGYHGCPYQKGFLGSGQLRCFFAPPRLDVKVTPPPGRAISVADQRGPPDFARARPPTGLRPRPPLD
jgi:hypothetical protein